MCPNLMSVVEEAQDVGYVHHHYKCVQHCKGDEYTYESGSTILQGKSMHTKPANLLYVIIYPTCSPCPVGINCDKHIQALPNYWGHKDQADLVTMIRFLMATAVKMIICVKELIPVISIELDGSVGSVRITGLNLCSLLNVF